MSKLNAANENNENQSQNFGNGEDVLDSVCPTDTTAVDERQQYYHNTNDAEIKQRHHYTTQLHSHVCRKIIINHKCLQARDIQLRRRIQ